ncbi:MAG: acylneuraminate cytidylyltransferase family protein [Elusimicrobiota bacterium]
MNILGVIPARGGSKRFKNKNIKDLLGKPVIGYTIEAALRSKMLDKIVVSTDSKAIAETVKRHYTVEVIGRPKEYAKDTSPIEEALLHAVEYMKKKHNYCADVLVWMQANVPIRENGIIDKAVKKLISTRADSCATCYEVDQVPELMKTITKNGMIEPLIRNVKGIRKQEFPARYLFDGSVVVLRVANLYKTRGIRKAHIYMGKKIAPEVQSSRMFSLELDVPDDMDIIKYYMLKNKRRLRRFS